MLKNRTCAVISFLLMAALLSTGPAFAADNIEALQNQIIEQQDRVRQDIRDLSVATETRALQGPSRSKVTSSVNNVIKGNKIRTERNTFYYEQGKEEHMVAVCNGEEVWVVIPGEFKVQIPIETIDKKSGFYYWWLPSFNAAKIVDVEKLLDRDLLVIEFNKKPQEKGLHKIWVDKNTLALIKAERVTASGDLLVSVFSDFKTLAPGYEIALKGSSFINDQLYDRYKVTSLKINSGVADDIFESTNFTEQERKIEQ